MTIGSSYPTAWKIKLNLMHAMLELDGQYHLQGTIHVDDAYLAECSVEARLASDLRIRFHLSRCSS